jgi:hypothetical protein
MNYEVSQKKKNESSKGETLGEKKPNIISILSLIKVSQYHIF